MDWIASSKNSYVEILTPGTSESDFILQQGIYKGNQVKMKSLVWLLIQYDLCPYRVNLGRGIYRGETEKTQEEDGHLQDGEKLGTDAPSFLPGRVNPADTLISDFFVSRLSDSTFLLFKPCTCGSF